MKQESVQMGIPRKLMGWMALIVWTKQVQVWRQGTTQGGNIVEGF